MSIIINKQVAIPPENETKVKIFGIAKNFGYYEDVKRIYKKYEDLYNRNKFDARANFDMAKNLIQELANIDINLILWLANEKGEIMINNVVAFTIVDMPDEK